MFVSIIHMCSRSVFFIMKCGFYSKEYTCWIFGLFKCRRFTDLLIFWMGLQQESGRGEEVLADRIYDAKAPLKRAPQTFFKTIKTMKKIVLAWYEHCNRWMKQQAILPQEFVHELKHHKSVFFSISLMNQPWIQNEEPLANVSYKE